MSGLLKAKEYDWKDSNVANFGSDEDREIKKESALTEKCWERVGKATQPFLFVWRVKQFTLEPVPDDEVGTFFNGDSYVVCKGTKLDNQDKLLYDVHFWIGKESTQDEYATAAYKTVELDTYLDDAAVQHREVEGYETAKFKSYFKKLSILKGGYATGFRHVKPEDYQPRLLRFCKEGKVTYMRQVPLARGSVHSGDVFILDLGTKAFQFNGSKCSAFEKNLAAGFLQDLESKRNGRCSTEVLDETDTDSNHLFWTSIPDVQCEPEPEKKDIVKALYRLSDASGSMEISLVCEGSAPMASVMPDDVYIIQAKEGLFIHIGRNCSPMEKKNALGTAHNFLQTSENPFLPITVVTEEQASVLLKGIWD